MDTFGIDLSFPASNVAPLLLGCVLEYKWDGVYMSARIVETEAYEQTDAASHSYKGRTPRTDVMFGPPGHLYVYFTYGMHYCCNVVTGLEGTGSAVLIRAVEPLEGIEIMASNRGGRSGVELTNGPAKLCQAFGIAKSHNGHDLRHEPLRLLPGEQLSSEEITHTTRIGISHARDVPWRFYVTGNPYVSRN